MNVINLTILMLVRLIYIAADVNCKNTCVMAWTDGNINYSEIILVFRNKFEKEIMRLLYYSKNNEVFHKKIRLYFKGRFFCTNNDCLLNMIEFTLLDCRRLTLMFKVTIPSHKISFILKREINRCIHRFNEMIRVESLNENPNIVNFLCWEYDEFMNLAAFQKNYLQKCRISWTIMEYLYFNFKHYLQFHINKKDQIKEIVLIKMLKDILNALVECHKNGIVHGDLKIENIMGKKYTIPEDHIHFVLIDFGLSVELDNGDEETHGLELNVGTSFYKSPEVMGKNPKLTTKSDIWSLGIILFLIKSKKYVESKMIIKTKFHSQKSILEEIQYLSCSEEMKDFISKCLKINFRERLTAEELRKHPLFTTPKVNNVDLGK